ncbi:2-C-methyl-D-erythritol 4-phosphate cytidylyltransferase [Methylonatrum kenyense]|nr:2-C-methyl-D-erythritol 4-phosphate cytidylyltransferase [Methylonatrum kenyense]
MGAAIPKQYLPLAGRSVLHWALAVLLDAPQVKGCVLAIDPKDRYWPEFRPATDKPLHVVDGGAERFQSVFNTLDFLLKLAPPGARVLVHDGVRPCLAAAALQRLLNQGLASESGALLAVPVRDTLKRQDPAGCVERTADRQDLWQAQTPQLFPLGLLHRALGRVIAEGLHVTDEAQAVEALGLRPRLVEGSVSNLKITRPDDLPLAEAILRARTATDKGSD